MKNFRKSLLTVFVGLGGLLLFLAGLDLIQLSPSFVLDVGILYMVLSILIYLFV